MSALAPSPFQTAIKSQQFVTAAPATGLTTVNVTITAVTLAKAFVLDHTPYNANNGQPSAGATAQLTSTTNLQFVANGAGTGSNNCAAQVMEFL